MAIIKQSTRQLLVTLIPASLVLLVIAMVSVIYAIPMPSITRDPKSLLDGHPLTGFLSSLGVLLWCATATVCWFAAVAVRASVAVESYRFLMASSLLSFYLLFDDLFMIHEALAPDHLGLSQRYVIFILGLIVASYLVVFRFVILKTNFIMLLLALGFLGLSVAFDLFFERWMWGLGHWVYFLEDGVKWLGIACWCSYFLRESYFFVGSDLRRS